MSDTRKLTVLVSAANAFEETWLLPWGRLVSEAMDAQLTHVQATKEDQWADLPRVVAARRADVVVAKWPTDATTVRQALDMATGVRVLLVDPRQHGPADIKRVVAPWSGNPHALDRLRLAGLLAKHLNVPGHVLRMVATEGPETDRVLQARHFRQVRLRDRVEVALAGVSLPVFFRLADEPVGATLTRVTPDDLVIVGGSHDWMMRNLPESSVAHDIRHSVAGPAAMLLSPTGTAVGLADVFHEGAIIMRSTSHSPVSEMVDLMVTRRQAPWHLKPLILERAKQISLGENAVFIHAQIPQAGQVLGGLFVPPGQAGRASPVVFLLLVPQEGYDVYLPVLAKLAAIAARPQIIDAMRACQTPVEVVSVLRNAEAEKEAMASASA